MKLGGTAKIENNVTLGGSARNISIPSGGAFTVGTGSNGVAAPAAGMRVGISKNDSAAVPFTFTTNIVTETIAQYFFSDSNSLELEFVNNKLGLKEGSGSSNPGTDPGTNPGTDPGADPGSYYPIYVPDTTPEKPEETTTEQTSGTTAPVEDYMIPVESGEDSVQVGVKISDGVAAVDEITADTLKDIIEKKSEDKTAEDKHESITIELSKSEQDVTGTELSKKSVETLSDVVSDENNNIDSVVINMKDASVELDAKTLEALQESMTGDTLKLVVEKTEEKSLNENQRDTLGKYDVTRTFEAYFESNGEKIHDFKGGKALVSLSFKPEKGKRAKNYKVYYVDEIGELQKMTTKYEDGLITFVTGHFSDYAIVYENVKEVLIAEPSMTSKGNIKLNWNKITGAIKYMVYGAKCGKSYKKLAELDAETDGNSLIVKKINGAALISGKTYKFVVVAYDALGNKLKSKTVHFIAGNTSEKYGNVETITALQKTVELTVGEKATVGAEYTMYEDKKHTPKKHGKALRFTSDCPDVAKVSKDGTVTAKSEGKAVIYVQDISGKWCTVEVTVKAK